MNSNALIPVALLLLMPDMSAQVSSRLAPTSKPQGRLLVPDARDIDGDGWTSREGDCDELVRPGHPFPERVNPGAYEVPGNGIDDDCNGQIDDAPSATCSFFSIFSPTALDLAQAMDLCTTTTVTKGPWGLISAELLRANGTSTPNALQVSVKTSFGGFMPQVGPTLAVLSTGVARAPGDPGFFSPGPCVGGAKDGKSYPSSQVPAPAAWLAAHGGSPVSAPGCPPSTILVYDSVLLRLRIRVPTNASALHFRYAFLTSEWPNTCSTYNDTALALVVEGASPSISADGNVLFDPLNNPVTVQTVAYEACSVPPCSGIVPLLGTGFDALNDASTMWHESVVPVLRGQVTTLEFHLWDGSDSSCDSTLLLDGLTWDLLP